MAPTSLRPSSGRMSDARLAGAGRERPP
jgi:hypothetical protein